MGYVHLEYRGSWLEHLLGLQHVLVVLLKRVRSLRQSFSRQTYLASMYTSSRVRSNHLFSSPLTVLFRNRGAAAPLLPPTDFVVEGKPKRLEAQSCKPHSSATDWATRGGTKSPPSVQYVSAEVESLISCTRMERTDLWFPS